MANIAQVDGSGAGMSWEAAGAGKDRADAAGRELLDRAAGVGRVEIARAVKGQAVWVFKPVLAKTEPTPPRVNFSIVLLP